MSVGKTYKRFLADFMFRRLLMLSSVPRKEYATRWSPGWMRNIAEYETVLLKNAEPIRLRTLFDADSGEMLAWTLRKDLSANVVLITPEFARMQAKYEADHFIYFATKGVAAFFPGEPSIELVDDGGKRFYCVSWCHRLDWFATVDGDRLSIVVDPSDGEVVSLDYQWRTVLRQQSKFSEGGAYDRVVIFCKTQQVPPISVTRKVFGLLTYVPILASEMARPNFVLMWHFRVLETDDVRSAHYWDIYLDQMGKIVKYNRSL